MNCHVVLVGLPGAGKSVVGKLVAKMMDVKFLDIDALLEDREGMSIAEIFTSRGEAEFRRLEKLETESALREQLAVIAPGGGWAAESDNMEHLPDKAFTVYLKTTPQAALARIVGIGNRPLLNAPDPLTRMSDLLTNRAPFYEKCEATVFTDGKTVDEVAGAIVELARGATGG